MALEPGTTQRTRGSIPQDVASGYHHIRSQGERASDDTLLPNCQASHEVDSHEFEAERSLVQSLSTESSEVSSFHEVEEKYIMPLRPSQFSLLLFFSLGSLRFTHLYIQFSSFPSTRAVLCCFDSLKPLLD